MPCEGLYLILHLMWDRLQLLLEHHNPTPCSTLCTGWKGSEPETRTGSC